MTSADTLTKFPSASLVSRIFLDVKVPRAPAYTPVPPVTATLTVLANLV